MKKQNSKKVPATEKTPVTQPTQEELDRRKGFIVIGGKPIQPTKWGSALLAA